MLVFIILFTRDIFTSSVFYLINDWFFFHVLYDFSIFISTVSLRIPFCNVESEHISGLSWFISLFCSLTEAQTRSEGWEIWEIRLSVPRVDLYDCFFMASWKLFTARPKRLTLFPYGAVKQAHSSLWFICLFFFYGGANGLCGLLFYCSKKNCIFHDDCGVIFTYLHIFFARLWRSAFQVLIQVNVFRAFREEGALQFHSLDFKLFFAIVFKLSTFFVLGLFTDLFFSKVFRK